MDIYVKDHGGWTHTSVDSVEGKDDDYFGYFITAKANTSLSATSILGPGNRTDITLLYENLYGDMIMLRRSSSSARWRDISPGLRSAAPDALLRLPFSSGLIMAGRSEIIVTKPKTPSRYTPFEEEYIITTYQNETFTSAERLFLPGTGSFLPNANDGGTYLLSIDKIGAMITFSSIYASDQWYYKGLSGQFPFPQVAALYTEQSGTLIVYYQTNNLLIAEKMWDLKSAAGSMELG